MDQNTSSATERPNEPFTPKLVTAWREGYSVALFRKDAVAALTVAIVALPLSMALAIASGGTPASGLYAAIVGGFLISALGGSRFQIGGPAGAFIVLIAAIIARHGFDGLLLAMMLSGVFQIGFGLLRLGSLIRFIPQAVLAGFMAGIAIIIFASQIRDLLGLTLPGKEPAPIVAKLAMLGQALPGFNPSALALSLATIAIILGLKRFRPGWPGLLIAVVLATLASVALGLGVETIGTRFGGIPSALPAPGLPDVSWARIVTLLPDAFAIAALGGIESLLSAKVADGMTTREHRPNAELVAQGIANIATALFGGICVTGTIARTATNVRAGASGPVSGMLAALILLGFMLVAAPLAFHVPLAALAGLLAVISWNMIERDHIRHILSHSRAQTAVMLLTFGLVLFVDLIIGIAAGVALSLLLARFAAPKGHA